MKELELQNRKDYLKMRLEYELNNQKNDVSTLSELSFAYSTLLSFNFDELELLYGDDFENTDMYISMKQEEDDLYDSLEKRFNLEEVCNLDLLPFFGPKFFLFEDNKSKTFTEEERVSLISNSDYVALDTKIKYLEDMISTTENEKLKLDVIEWIKYKKACLNNFGSLKDPNIVYLSSSSNDLSLELEPLLKITFNGTISAKTLMKEDDSASKRAGTIHIYEGKIVDIFLSTKLIDELVINNSLNKYICVLNLDVPRFTFIEAIENNPNNIVSGKRAVTKEDLSKLQNDDNPYWLVFNVEVVKTECYGFMEPSLLKTYSFEGFKILNESQMTGKQKNYVEEYKEQVK